MRKQVSNEARKNVTLKMIRFQLDWNQFNQKTEHERDYLVTVSQVIRILKPLQLTKKIYNISLGLNDNPRPLVLFFKIKLKYFYTSISFPAYSLLHYQYHLTTTFQTIVFENKNKVLRKRWKFKTTTMPHSGGI